MGNGDGPVCLHCRAEGVLILFLLLDCTECIHYRKVVSSWLRLAVLLLLVFGHAVSATLALLASQAE